jgi:hypothetical protein
MRASRFVGEEDIRDTQLNAAGSRWIPLEPPAAAPRSLSRTWTSPGLTCLGQSVLLDWLELA